MRLRIGVAGWAASEHSGAHRRLFSLLRAAAPMLQTGEELVLLHAPNASLEQLPPGVRAIPVPIPPSPTWRRVLAEARHLPSIVERLLPHVLDWATLPLLRMRCHAVLTIHDVRDLGPYRRRSRLLARHVLRQSVARAAHVVVPSRFTALSLEGLVPTSTPISVIPGGVDVDAFTPLAPFASNPRDATRPSTLTDPDAGERGYFLHVGHLEARKNLLMLLSAYAQLVQTLGANAAAPDLLLAGRDAGAGAALRERAVLLDLVGRVHFLGPVSEARLRQLYAGARAVVLPSLYEGFGQSALEALAAGRPLLISDRGALPEVAGAAAWVLPAEDPMSWAHALGELVARADVDTSAAAAARHEHARRFRWEAAAGMMLELWRGIAEGKLPAGGVR